MLPGCESPASPDRRTYCLCGTSPASGVDPWGPACNVRVVLEVRWPVLFVPKAAPISHSRCYHFDEEDALMLKPLCLSLLALASVTLRAQGQSPPIHANPLNASAAILNGPVPEPPPRLLAGTPASSDSLAAPDSDNICYRIRAYLFKRDDDHPPQLVGSTTCGPRQPRARNAQWPKARLELLK